MLVQKRRERYNEVNRPNQFVEVHAEALGSENLACMVEAYRNQVRFLATQLKSTRSSNSSWEAVVNKSSAYRLRRDLQRVLFLYRVTQRAHKKAVTSEMENRVLN